MIRIRSVLTNQRHALAAIAVIGIALVLAHGAPGQDHMAGMDESHVGDSAIVSMCLAVLEVAAAGAVLVGAWLLAKRRPAVNLRELRTTNSLPTTERKRFEPMARAGPALLQVYRL